MSYPIAVTIFILDLSLKFMTATFQEFFELSDGCVLAVSVCSQASSLEILTPAEGDCSVSFQQPPQHANAPVVFVCDQCSYSTKLEHLYQRHVIKHSLDKPFLCPDCGYSDFDHMSFVDHMMDHQQTRILSCCFCKYRTNIFGMRLHIAKHRAVEPYDCSLCEFSSNHPGSLKNHMFLLHTKKFSCNYCKKIMSKYSLMKHAQKMHGVNLENSQVQPFFAVNARGKIEDPKFVADQSREDNAESMNTPTDSLLLPLNLPTPKIIIKRMNVEVPNELNEPEMPLTNPADLTSPKIDPKVPKLTIRVLNSKPTDPKFTIKLPQPETNANSVNTTLAPPNSVVSSSVNIKLEPLDESEEEIDVKPDVGSLIRYSKPRAPKIMFQCNNCSFTSRKKSLLRLHAPKHLLDPNFVCTECDFKEPSSYIFAKHLASRREGQGKIIHCCFCNYTSKSVSNLRSHLDKHRPVSLHDCPKCGMSFSSKSNLGEHYRNIHVHKIECPDCGKQMTKHSMKKHRKTHLNEKTKKPNGIEDDTEIPTVSEFVVPSKPYFKCNSCSFRTRMKSLLRRHVAKHAMPEACWGCSLCNFTDSSAYRFAFHLKYHSEGDAYDCCFCDYSSIAIHSLARHLEVHRSIHFFDCSKCDRSFSQYTSLRKHYVEKHVEKHQCIDCGEVMSLSKLLLHRKIHGTNETSSARINTLSVPKKYTSNNLAEVPDRLYKCSFCNFSTDIEHLATKHEAKHRMDEAYYECTVCHYKDSHNLSFAKHLSTSCLQSVSCCFCNYVSTSDHNLAQHLEMHRSIHFHDCYLCDKSYSSGGSLFKHIKAFHSDKSTCQECGEIVTYYELLQHKKLHGTTANLPVHMDWTSQVIQRDQESCDTSMFHCYHCSYSTRKKFLLRRHAVKHLIDTRLVCPDCDFKENHTREFAKHLISCQGGLNCSFCPLTGTDLSQMSSHLGTHRPVLLYDCTECKHSTNTRANIREHYKKMHVAEYKCSQCNEVMSRYKLKQHRLKHTMPMPTVKADPDTPNVLSVSVCNSGALSCGYCDYSTDLQYLLDRHVAKHQTNSDLVCPMCGFADQSCSEFSKHLRTHNDQKATFDCCFCLFSTVHSGNLTHHLEGHKTVHFFDCPKCDKTYSAKGTLKIHYESYHVAEHVCKTCDVVMTKEKLILHEEMHAAQDNPVFHCNDCDYRTKKKALIRNHALKHLRARLICSECNLGFTRAEEFVYHRKMHNSPSDTLRCCFCDFSSTITINLVQHLEIHQSMLARFWDCPKCNRSFPNSSILTEHVRQHHKEQHRCSVCGMVMSYSRLMRHMKQHRELGKSILNSKLSNRFRCNHCIFTTKKKSLLRRHAPKHLVNNSLSCSICGFKTNISWRLACHLETHFDDGTINCCFCEFSSGNKHKLTTHLENHRKVHLHDCTKCDRSFMGSSGHYTLQKHFFKMHIQKHVCQKHIRPLEKCGKRLSLYQLLKHQSAEHKAVVKEVPYYICRGPKIRAREEVALMPESVSDPLRVSGSTGVEPAKNVVYLQ